MQGPPIHHYPPQPPGQPAQQPVQPYPRPPAPPPAYPSYPPPGQRPFYVQPTYDPKHVFSWESFPGSYPRLRRRPTTKGLAKPAGGLLLIIGILLLITSMSVFYVPAFSDFDAPVTLTGMVTEPGGYPVEGANVTVISQGRTYTTTTDRFGIYTMVGIPSGEVTVQASMDGYKTQNMTIYLVKELSEEANLILTSGEGYTEGYASYQKKSDILGSMYASAILGAIFSAFAILGGWWAMKRQHLSVGLTGGLLAIGQPVVLMGTMAMIETVSILLVFPGALALVLMITARHEFKGRFDE